nr:MMPL family transporter [Mycobacterium riyadhense]
MPRRRRRSKTRRRSVALSTWRKNDDTFYLPPEVFTNPDFKRGLKLFLSPDGKAARMIVTHDGDHGDGGG